MGVPNKKTVAKVSEYLAEQNVNPAEEVLKIINEKKIVHDSKTNLQKEEFALAAQARADLWLELLSFCHAKPKVLEINPVKDDFDENEFHNVKTEDLMKVLKSPARGTA